MSLSDLFKKPNAETQAQRAASAARQSEILAAIQDNRVPEPMRQRLAACAEGKSPWISTLSPAELRIARSHGIRPVATVSATCWMHYGYSWTRGHAEGWGNALERLKNEARAAGANAVLDVKMRTIPMDIADSMDFSLVGTAVKVEGLPPSPDPVVATVPALEFVKLLEADIVPTGIAVGAHYYWMNDWRGRTNLFWAGNTECTALSSLWETVRQAAHSDLRENARALGNGVLAHVHFSEMFEQEANDTKQYLARYIVIATTVDVPKITSLARQHSHAQDYYAKGYVLRRDMNRPPHHSFPDLSSVSPVLKESNTFQLPHDFRMVVDMHAGKTPLAGTSHHHQSYSTNAQEGAI